MKHYDPETVLDLIATCAILQCVTDETVREIRALVTQANSAHEAQVRDERELALRLRTAVDERQAEIAEALEGKDA